MTTRGLLGAGKFAAISLAMAAAVSMPLTASASGWGGGHGYHGGNHYSYRGGSHGGYHGGYYRSGGHWEGGRWIAGAIVTGAVVGLIADALQPAPVYYDRPVVYGPPPTVIYEQAPPVTRRVVQTRTVVYDDGYPTQYIRDDGYDRDDGN
ncbi:MAG TPA: hypothetical protein VGN24_04385 [Rhodanobacter sp.]|nr:hypothetical protein [Rhodanobacter sp.]